MGTRPRFSRAWSFILGDLRGCGFDGGLFCFSGEDLRGFFKGLEFHFCVYSTDLLNEALFKGGAGPEIWPQNTNNF